MKACKGCGMMISDTAGDFCEKCQKVVRKKNMESEFNNQEKTVSVLADILLVLGIIATLIMLFTIVVTGEYSFNKEFSLIGLAITVSTLFLSVLFWALLKLSVGVSVNVRKIAEKNK